MTEELKGELIEVVKSSTEVLSDEDALEIVGICKRAVSRGIADVTEQYLEERLRGGDTE